MGETALVDSKVADAVSLIKKLDADGAGPGAVVWYFYGDADEWRLLVASQAFDALLPKQEAVAYRKLAETISSLGLQSLGMSDLKIMETKSALLQSLRRLLATDPQGIVQAHFMNLTLNGIFIKEMVIMRSAL